MIYTFYKFYKAKNTLIQINLSFICMNSVYINLFSLIFYYMYGLLKSENHINITMLFFILQVIND